MATVLKTDPVGIDFEIDRIQKELFNGLTTEFKWTDYKSFHRAYKNDRENSVIPEIYISDGEYEEVLFDDGFNATSFFLAEDTATQISEGLYSQGISIIFQLDLKKLYPLILHRADEEARQNIIIVLERNFKSEIKDIQMGVNKVYGDLNLLDVYKDHVKLDDMSFFHVLRVDMEIIFSYDSDC